MLPSPFDRRVGIRIRTFEACSGFTHVTAHRIAQPPKAAFVTRLQPCQLPDRTARQLPDQSTTLWVESSSTSDPRLRGARSKATVWQAADHFRSAPNSGHSQRPPECLKGARRGRSYEASSYPAGRFGPRGRANARPMSAVTSSRRRLYGQDHPLLDSAHILDMTLATSILAEFAVRMRRTRAASTASIAVRFLASLMAALQPKFGSPSR